MADPERSMVRNVADARQVKDAGKKSRRKRLDDLNDLRVILSNKAGQRFIWRILEWSNLYGPAYQHDPMTTAYNEGKRSIGIQLQLDVMEASPATLLDMMRALIPPVDPADAVEPGPGPEEEPNG